MTGVVCTGSWKGAEEYMLKDGWPEPRKKLIIYDLDATLIEGFLVETPCHNELCLDGMIPEVHAGVPVATPCPTCKGRGHNFKQDPDHPYDEVRWIPGTQQALRMLHAAGFTQAIATNQAGVAWGYQTEEQVFRKLARVVREVGIPMSYRAALHAPGGQAPYDDEALFSWRKPGPGMLFNLMNQHQVEAKDTIFIGDMSTDEEAAHAAGVRYYDHAVWFRR